VSYMSVSQVHIWPRDCTGVGVEVGKDFFRSDFSGLCARLSVMLSCWCSVRCVRSVRSAARRLVCCSRRCPVREGDVRCWGHVVVGVLLVRGDVEMCWCRR
jgi:hypothetical protein